MTHSWHDDFCLICGSELRRCICDKEHRASRIPAHVAPLDPSFLAALSAPVPEEALREKGVRR